jgi:hypothetical protein
VLKGNFASSVFNIYNAKTQMMRILVTGPQCVNLTPGENPKENTQIKKTEVLVA